MATPSYHIAVTVPVEGQTAGAATALEQAFDVDELVVTPVAAIAVADAFEGQLRLVAVGHSGELLPDRAWVGFADADIERAAREHRERELERGLALVPERLAAARAVVVGEPARALRTEAERGMDLLVVGSRGYGPVRRVLLGSVAPELLHAAPCPVIVCPRGAHPDTMDVPPDAKSSETSGQT